MTQYAPPPIKGFTPLSDQQVAAVNQNKIAEENFLRYLDDLQRNPAIDQRWLGIARVYIEMGFMTLNRSIMKPARLALPDDFPAEAEVPLPPAPGLKGKGKP